VSVTAEGKVDVFVTPALCCGCGGEVAAEAHPGRRTVCRCQTCGKVMTFEPLRRPGRSGDVLDLHAEVQRDALKGPEKAPRGLRMLFWAAVWLAILNVLLFGINQILQAIQTLRG
jgi:hypothetical protein